MYMIGIEICFGLNAVQNDVTMKKKQEKVVFGFQVTGRWKNEAISNQGTLKILRHDLATTLIASNCIDASICQRPCKSIAGYNYQN